MRVYGAASGDWRPSRCPISASVQRRVRPPDPDCSSLSLADRKPNRFPDSRRRTWRGPDQEREGRSTASSKAGAFCEGCARAARPTTEGGRGSDDAGKKRRRPGPLDEREFERMVDALARSQGNLAKAAKLSVSGIGSWSIEYPDGNERGGSGWSAAGRGRPNGQKPARAHSATLKVTE